MTNKFGSNIILPASPAIDEKKYPDLYAALLGIHNAIFSIQSYLDLFTAARVTITATANIRQGSAVNIYAANGVISGRPANATNGTKPCLAFALTDIVAGSSGDVQTIGINDLISGLTPGTVYYLSTSDGVIIAAAPAAAGNLVQEIGVALSTTSLLYRPAFNWKQL